MTDEQDTIRQLLDRELVKELRAKYCRFLDLQLWEELKEIFTDDAVLELAGGVRLRGAQAYVDLMSEHFDGRGQVIHHCVMPELTFPSEDRCRGIWALFSYVDRGPTGQRVLSQNYSYYCEEYLRTEAGWKIASLRLLRIREDPYQRTPGAPPSSLQLQSAGRDSLSFFDGTEPT